MGARDMFHDAVKSALIKEGWTVTHDPLFIRWGGYTMFVDLGAERLIAAEKDGQRIAIEIKSFLGTSSLDDFHHALGQFLNYKIAMRETEPDRTLYVAVPQQAYEDVFSQLLVQTAVKENSMRLIVYNAKQEVLEWIS